MSRALSLIAPTTGYASPNQLVTAQLATNVGFNPNDYVYAYGNNQVGNLGSTIGVGLNTTYIAGLKVNGFVQTGFAPTAVMSGPYSASTTYTGTTRTIANVFQSQVALNGASTVNGNSPGMAVLNNGNLAFVFRDSTASNLKIAITTPSGSSVLAPTTISSTSSAGSQPPAIGAMSDGGFVVAYCAGSSSYYRRFDSAGTSLLAETQCPGSLASVTNGSTGWLSIAGNSGGNYCIIGSNNGGQLYASVISGASNTSLNNFAVTTNNSSYNNYVIGLSNGSFLALGNNNANNIRYTIISGTGTQGANGGLVSNQNTTFQAAPFDGGFVLSYANSSGYASLGSYSNDGTSIASLNSYYTVTGSSMLTVAVSAESNTAYTMFNASGLFFARMTNINSSAMAIATSATAISGTNYADIGELHNALNGSVAMVYASTTNIPSFVTVNQATYTQNTTTLTNTGLYTPSNGYYLLGIGATTAAAGSSGLIYTNGGIALPSTYPSVSTGYAFDYQSNSYWAQRGTINGRTINLQGAQ